MTKIDMTARRDHAVRELLATLAAEQERLATTTRRLNTVLEGTDADVDRTVAELLLERFRAGHLDALLPMYETRCWSHLGARSWAAFCRDELGIARSRSYQLATFGQVRRALAGVAMFEHLAEAHARPLGPIADQPDAVRAVWSAACQRAGDRPPTAADVKHVVDAWAEELDQ